MILVLVVGGVMGWKARRVSLQRRAVAAIQQLGGTVKYDWYYAGDVFTLSHRNEPTAPLWLRRLVGDEYFQEVLEVAIENHEFQFAFGKDQLACLDGIEHIESLRLQLAGLGRVGLARLAKLKRLTSLAITNNYFDAEEIGGLGRLTELEYIHIELTSNGNEGLSFLPNLRKLRRFESYQGINDSGFAWLARCERLEKIEIVNPTLTDTGLKHLANSNSLKELQVLGASKISDDGLAHLGIQTNLRSIDIRGMPMTEVGLGRLCKLPRLKWLGSVRKVVFPLQFGNPKGLRTKGSTAVRRGHRASASTHR